MAEKKIEGLTFKVEKILATEAILLQTRLLKAIGSGVERLPTILAGASTKDKEPSPEVKAASDAAAIAAFTDIFTKADPEELTTLIKDIVEIAKIKRPSGSYEKLDMDADLSDKQSTIPLLVIFVLKEIFGDFFTGLMANGGLKGLA